MLRSCSEVPESAIEHVVVIALTIFTLCDKRQTNELEDIIMSTQWKKTSMTEIKEC